MNTLKISVPLGVGDLIYIKAQLDANKKKYSLIEICPAFNLIEAYRDNIQEYRKFVNDVMNLLFSKPPYEIAYNKPYPFMDLGSQGIWSAYGLIPMRPRLSNILCAGNLLTIGPYYVMTTKIRELPRAQYNRIKLTVMNAISNISKIHPIILLGERKVGMNSEYRIHGSDAIYSIYDDLVKLPNIIDLTIPELGLTTPDIVQFQQDCLIMSKAISTITLGVGGNFCMATAVGNVIGYRVDDYLVANYLYDSKSYKNTLITKNFTKFLNCLRALI